MENELPPQAMQAAPPPPSEDDAALEDQLKKLERYGKAIDAHWTEWLKEARECFDFVAGNQLSQDEKDRMHTEGKIAVAFNRIGPVIDAVSGAEILGRQQVKYSPRTLGDVQVNEVITQAAEWVRDQCDAGGEESDAFRDCFICGLGYTETRTDYEENPKGKILIEGGEAMKCLPDPTARKANAIDARYLRFRNEMSLDEFEELYPDQAEAARDPEAGMKQTSNNPRDDYDKGEKKGADTVTVDLYQWYETEKVYIAPSQDGTTTVEYPAEAFEELLDMAEQAGRQIPYTTRNVRVYYEAIVSGSRWIEKPKKLRHRHFRFKFVTGKRDKNAKVWYGLARPMKDPQKWANAFFSMVLHIIRTNAKGGMVIERGAEGGETEDPIRDQKHFEETWAKSDEITWVAPGALSENRMKPKPPPQIPAAFAQLFEQSVAAIRDTSGVSQEMMGLVEANQPGILEHQRKQASFAILASFFDSFRRYRRFQGELLLRMMKDLPPDTLVRIVSSEDDKERYVPIVMGFKQDQDVEDYDVIVDEAPAGPNQKDKTWSMLMQILPAVKELMTPPMWLEVLKFSPLPQAFVERLRAMLTEGTDDQKAQVMEQMKMGFMQLQGQQAAADVRKTNAEAGATEIKTQIAATFPDRSPQLVA